MRVQVKPERDICRSKKREQCRVAQEKSVPGSLFTRVLKGNTGAQWLRFMRIFPATIWKVNQIVELLPMYVKVTSYDCESIDWTDNLHSRIDQPAIQSVFVLWKRSVRIQVQSHNMNRQLTNLRIQKALRRPNNIRNEIGSRRKHREQGCQSNPAGQTSEGTLGVLNLKLVRHRVTIGNQLSWTQESKHARHVWCVTFRYNTQPDIAN